MTRRALAAVVLCALTELPLMASAQAEPTASVAADTAPTLAELHALAAQLAAADGNARRAAFDALRSLGDDALEAMRARLTELSTRGFDNAATLEGMSELRRVQGITDPAAPVDLAQGALRVLERDRGRGAVLAVELIALLRALEAQKSPQAAELIVSGLFALDSKLFRYEAPRTRQRLGVLLIPALLHTRTHPRSWLRKYAEESLLELHVDSPGRAVQQDDVVLLAAILDAYGDTLTFDAMPVVVSYLTDERVAVRDAARRAIRRFGKNAIWQIRERYVNATGREADPSWSFQRTLDELYRLHDAPRAEAFTAALDGASRALDAGDFAAATQALDEALLANPHHPDAKRAGTLYTRIAAARLDAGELEPALAAYRRALRLDPSGVDAASSKARVIYLEAELRLAQGVVDLEAYREALALDPAFTRAADALDELSGERAARDKLWRRAIGLVAALLMAFAGLSLLRNAKRREDQAAPAPREEPIP